MQGDERCNRCGQQVRRKRAAQLYCSTQCRDAHKKHRKRAGPKPHRGDMALTDAPAALSDGSTVVWPTTYDLGEPTPGALQGDDYPLTYDENGYPELPACLDRRPFKLAEAA